MGRPKGVKNKPKITPETIPSEVPLKITPETVPTVTSGYLEIVGDPPTASVESTTSTFVYETTITPLWDHLPGSQPVARILSEQEQAELKATIEAGERMKEQAHPKQAEIVVQVPNASQQIVFINPPDDFKVDDHIKTQLPKAAEEDKERWRKL